jgi:phage recombination protein Bet
MTNTALTALTSKLAARLDMGDGHGLIETLKATAFKGQVSDAQMTALMVVANQYGLNPWTKEIYAFPDKNNGIVPVVGVDGWSRIINDHPQFDGIEFDQGDESCTCIIYRKDRSRPTRVTEYRSECGRGTGPWQSHPKRMLRHKAMIQCARLAFGYGGIYDQDEAERIVESTTVKHMGPVDEIKPALDAPASRADKVRGAAEKAKALPAPSLDDVLTAINTAPSMQALKAAAEDAAHLPTDDAKRSARNAYAARKAVLMGGPMVAADAETGEVPAPAQPAGLAEHADFLAEMDGAE